MGILEPLEGCCLEDRQECRVEGLGVQRNQASFQEAQQEVQQGVLTPLASSLCEPPVDSEGPLLKILQTLPRSWDVC